MLGIPEGISGVLSRIKEAVVQREYVAIRMSGALGW